MYVKLLHPEGEAGSAGEQPVSNKDATGIKPRIKPVSGLYPSVRIIVNTKRETMANDSTVPMLFPVEPDQFWEQMRLIIREEMAIQEKKLPEKSVYQTPGLTYKPLYKMKEVCQFLQVTRPTIYDWIKLGKLKPYKIRSRVYFLYDDIKKLLSA